MTNEKETSINEKLYKIVDKINLGIGKEQENYRDFALEIRNCIEFIYTDIETTDETLDEMFKSIREKINAINEDIIRNYEEFQITQDLVNLMAKKVNNLEYDINFLKEENINLKSLLVNAMECISTLQIRTLND